MSRSAKTVGRWALGCSLLAGFSLWLNAHNRLLLLIDPKTGEKYCVEELPQFLGLAPESWAAQLAMMFSQLWMPVGAAALTLGAWLFIQHLRAKGNET